MITVKFNNYSQRKMMPTMEKFETNLPSSSATITDKGHADKIVNNPRRPVARTMSGRTMHCTVLEGPLNCLSTDKSYNHVVVAGRNVFKVFAIEDDEFQEKANLRVGKHLNLNYSASDVMWNPLEDNVIASAATNGAVVIWDLHKISRSKQEYVFSEHKRTVNKVCFHGSEAHYLMSGSQDGSMKLFDLRQRSVASTFCGSPESVRDVQFSPHLYFQFAAAIENGKVQIWDMRNNGRCEKHFTAHNGPTFSIDWHPDDKNWIASAGRDKVIKVWDLSNPPNVKNIHRVRTIASVACIKWRPNRRFHIASCSLLVDFNINVWEIRRPYIPFAAFSEHKDVVTGIVWKPNDPQTFLSSSKDCTLYQHLFKDATRPVDRANPVGCDINIEGRIAQSSHDKLGNKSAIRSHMQSRAPMRWIRPSESRSEQFTTVNSTLQETVFAHPALNMHSFIECAKRYRLRGLPLEELCEHNADVALSLGMGQVSQTWRMLKLLYSDNPPTHAAPTLGKNDSLDVETERSHVKAESRPTLEHKMVEIDIKDKHIGDTSTGISEEESDVQDMEADRTLGLTNITNTQNTSHSDFFFGDCDMDQGFDGFEALPNLANGQDWTLPNEAFQLRHEILERASSPDPLAHHNGHESPPSGVEGEMNIQQVPLMDETNIREEILSLPSFTSHVPSWHFTKLVVDMLSYYAEQGDVQMAASVLVILGKKIRSDVDEISQEQWLMSYIDLLGRFRLWTVATEVINLSNHSAVGSLNLQSTTVYTSCGKCGKELLPRSWLCDRCTKQPSINTCSICHLPVKGLYVWCQGCSHGGHLRHIQEWLARNSQCPAGCGHLCEYT